MLPVRASKEAPFLSASTPAPACVSVCLCLPPLVLLSCCAVLCYAVLCCAALCFAVLCWPKSAPTMLRGAQMRATLGTHPHTNCVPRPRSSLLSCPC